MQDLVQLESLTEAAAQFLNAAIQARLGILVAGGTSSGKTNFLNVLAGLFPEGERVIVIEDTRELQLPIQDVVYQTVRLHDRVLHTRTADGWRAERLQP